MALQGALILVAGWLLLMSAGAAAQTRHVVLLYSYNRSLPAQLAIESGLRAVLPDSTEVSSEFLDTPRFSGPAYNANLTHFLAQKYAAWPPDVVVATGNQALLFALKHRGELFAKVPVVIVGVERSVLESMPPLPRDVIGVPVAYDLSGTVALALRLHAKAQRLVLVTGAGAQDRAWEAQLREAVRQVAGRATAEFLAGLPTEELMSRLGALEDEAVVVTTGYFQDGAGREFVPRRAVERIAQAANAPVYGPADSFMGSGIVGGSMVNFAAMGQQAGEIVLALLGGTSPERLRLPALTPTRVQLDWRQVRRWGIDPDRIPVGAVIDYKEPPFLEQHRSEAIAGALVVVLQSTLIGWLLTERRRRRLVELAMQKQRFELVHAARLAVAGELTASIAHEINQPLGAILSNADAADLILDREDRQAELRAILADIRRDDQRASEVIRRLRALLTKQEVEHQVFNLSQAVADVAALMQAEAQRRGLALAVHRAPAVSLVGDRIQLQQVLINLILNAMDATADAAEARRTIRVTLQSAGAEIAVAVRDQGQGIDAEQMPRLFDSFFTTKHKGMGLGLPIARTIVEAHGGRIWAESTAGQGAVFHVALPAAAAAAGSVSSGAR